MLAYKGVKLIHLSLFSPWLLASGHEALCLCLLNELLDYLLHMGAQRGVVLAPVGVRPPVIGLCERSLVHTPQPPAVADGPAVQRPPDAVIGAAAIWHTRLQRVGRGGGM